MSFKTATELGLTEPQRCGLVRALAALESGQLAYEDRWIDTFNMGQWGGKCGTACCLGGSAEVFGRLTQHELHHQSNQLSRIGNQELRKLFYPHHHIHAFHATTKQGAAALRHYLTTGKENWQMAMETPR